MGCVASTQGVDKTSAPTPAKADPEPAPECNTPSNELKGGKYSIGADQEDAGDGESHHSDKERGSESGKEEPPSTPPTAEDDRRRSSVFRRGSQSAPPANAHMESPEEMLMREFFIFDDAKVPINEEKAKLQQRDPRNPKRIQKANQKKSNPAPSSTSGKGAPSDASSFVWSDAVIDPEIGFGGGDAATAEGTGTEEDPEPSSTCLGGYSQYNLLGHSTRVKCISLSPNERHFVSCSNEDTIIAMHDIHTGKEILSFFGHDDTIISASFSNDGKYLATTSRDNTMVLWDAVIGQQVAVFDHDKVVICCCFSKDAGRLVSGCQDKVCRVWSIRKRREMLSYSEHQGIIVSVKFSPDGEQVCSAAADRTLRLWDSTSGKTQRVLEGHKGIVLACTYSNDGASIVSNDETILRVWKVEDGSCSFELPVASAPRPYDLPPSKKLAWTLCTFAPGRFGFYVVAVCNDKVVYIFDPETGEEEVSFSTRAPVYCLSSGLHSHLTFGDSCGNIYVVVLR